MDLSQISTLLQVTIWVGVLVVFGAHAVFGSQIKMKWKSYPLAQMPRWVAGTFAIFPLALFMTIAGGLLFSR